MLKIYLIFNLKLYTIIYLSIWKNRTSFDITNSVPLLKIMLRFRRQSLAFCPNFQCTAHWIFCCKFLRSTVTLRKIAFKGRRLSFPSAVPFAFYCLCFVSSWLSFSPEWNGPRTHQGEKLQHVHQTNETHLAKTSSNSSINFSLNYGCRNCPIS